MEGLPRVEYVNLYLGSGAGEMGKPNEERWVGRETERSEGRFQKASRQEAGILNGGTLTRGNEHSAIRLAPSGIVHIKSALFECQKYPGTCDSVSRYDRRGKRERKYARRRGGLDFEAGESGRREFLRADTAEV